LLGVHSEDVKKILLKAAADPVRLVRLAAASSLLAFPREEFSPAETLLIDNVNKEYEESLVTRPDLWSAYFNLGNYYQNMGKTGQALA